MTLTKTLIFLCLLQVTLQLHLFESARCSYKTKRGKWVHNKNYGQVLSLNNELFPLFTTHLRVNTTNMKMPEGAVKLLPHLQHLSLKDCGIRVLKPHCFQELPALEKLHLQDNDLSFIDEKVFNFLPIKELWLQRNEIASIRPGAFDNMPNLEEIKLNGNELTQWDGRWFANTPQLSDIYFRANKIEKLPARAFVNIKTKHEKMGIELVDTRILLSGNKITHIDPDALEGIDALEELDLKNNKLESVDWKVFRHVTMLSKLSLRRNGLKSVDGDAFDNLTMLKVLDLAKNSLECVPFKVVAKAELTDLSKNCLMEIECVDNLLDRLGEEKMRNRIKATKCRDE